MAIWRTLLSNKCNILPSVGHVHRYIVDVSMPCLSQFKQHHKKQRSLLLRPAELQQAVLFVHIMAKCHISQIHILGSQLEVGHCWWLYGPKSLAKLYKDITNHKCCNGYFTSLQFSFHNTQQFKQLTEANICRNCFSLSTVTQLN